jgi:hypothetical protein
MSVIRVIENKTFKGHRTIKRSGGLRIQVLASNTGFSTASGILGYSVATTGCFVTVNTAGTGTKINV